MKKIIILVAVIVYSIAVNAQRNSTNPTVFSVGVEASVPSGDFNKAGYNVGVGGSVQVSHKVASDLSLTLYAGYLNYSNKKPLIGGSARYHLSVIPILAGAKFWLSPKVYAQGQLGVAFNSTKLSNSNSTANKSTGFAYSPGLGFVIANNIDLVLKYFGNSVSNSSTSSGGTLSSFGARLAYNFLHRK